MVMDKESTCNYFVNYFLVFLFTFHFKFLCNCLVYSYSFQKI